MNGQIYVYYTSNSQVEYPYKSVLYSNDRIFIHVRDKDVSNAEILEEFRTTFDKSDILYENRGRTFFYYTPEHSSSEKRIFTHTYNGQLFFDSFSKDMKRYESWGSKSLDKKTYSLLRVVDCDVSVITNGEMSSTTNPLYENNYTNGNIINNSSRQQYDPTTRNKSKQHDSGSSSSRKACTVCKYTNGRCNVCKGSGKVMKSSYGTSTYVRCDECGGSGYRN